MKTKPVCMNFGVTISLSLLAVSLLAVNACSQTPDSNFYIFLAFGQSNMEGYAAGSNTQIEKQDTANVPARFQLLPAVNWPNNSRIKGTWTTAVPPLCRSSTGLCPCDYFGRTMTDSLPTAIRIGIINVSVAGCAIEMFDKDKYQTYVAAQADWLKAIATGYGGSPYARLVEMGKAAQKDGVIKGFLLHQGESGSSTGQWANEVKKIYIDLIKDLSLDSTKMPILAGGLPNDNNNGSLPWTLVNPTRVIKNAYVVSSKGCTINSSGIHFDAPGYRLLGKRFADSMLVAFKKLGTGPVAVRVDQRRTSAGFSIGNDVELRAGTASISFEIPQRTVVSVKVYTMGGREIAKLAEAEYARGRHSLELGPMAMRAGVFVLKMDAGPLSATRTFIVGAK